MMRKLLYKPKYEKGVAGLNVLLSVIIMLFILGFLVMIFAMMGGELGGTDTILKSQGPNTVRNETITWADNAVGTTLTTCGTHTNGIATVLTVYNSTTPAELVATNNYTVSKCLLIQTAASQYNGTAVNVTYTYTYSGSAFDIINDTGTELANVTDWFGIIIVITAMVVLILLTVIIISAIRGTGLVGLGGEGKPPRETA